MARTWLLVHPSDELYGADRVALQVAGVLGASSIARCWLPMDVSYPTHAMCRELGELGIAVEHVDYPVLRREHLDASRVQPFVRRWRRCRDAACRARKSGVDAVYLTTSSNIHLAPIFKRRGCFVVLHVQEIWTGLERRVLTAFLPWVDRVIAVSDDVARRIPGSPPVVRNGFPDIYFGAPPLPRRDRTLRFLLASRWTPRKGHALLLRAWRLANLDSAELNILGGPPPSGDRVDVDELVASEGLSSVVQVLGEGDVQDQLVRSDVVLVPSVRPDPLPTIAIEAARAARAVVASNVGGLPEIVDDGRTGWLVAPSAVHEWAGTLRRITASEARLRGLAGRDFYEQRFMVDRFREELAQAIA